MYEQIKKPNNNKIRVITHSQRYRKKSPSFTDNRYKKNIQQKLIPAYKNYSIIQAMWENLDLGNHGITSESTIEDVASVLANSINLPESKSDIEEAIKSCDKPYVFSIIIEKIISINKVAGLKLFKWNRKRQKNKSLEKDKTVPSKIDKTKNDVEEKLNKQKNKELEGHKKKLSNLGYNLIKKIGKGGFGGVYLVKNNSNRKFAVKYVEAGDSAARNEFNIVKNLKHTDIPKALRCNGQYIIFEYVEGKDMLGMIPITEKEALEAGINVAKIIEYLHKEAKISHGDIKPANIMIDKNKKYKLIDFGESKKFPDNEQSKKLIKADVGMIANLIRRLIMGNNVCVDEEWPTGISKELRELVKKAMEGGMSLNDFKNGLLKVKKILNKKDVKK